MGKKREHEEPGASARGQGPLLCPCGGGCRALPTAALLGRALCQIPQDPEGAWPSTQRKTKSCQSGLPSVPCSPVWPPPTLPPWPPLSFLLCPPVPASPTAPRGQTLRGQREMARSGVPGGKERSPPWTGQRPRQLTDTPPCSHLRACPRVSPLPRPLHLSTWSALDQTGAHCVPRTPSPHTVSRDSPAAPRHLAQRVAHGRCPSDQL